MACLHDSGSVHALYSLGLVEMPAAQNWILPGAKEADLMRAH